MQSVFTPAGWAAPAWPMLITLIVVVCIIFFGEYLMDLVSKIMPCFIIGNLVLDEGIDNYWKALDEEDREWSIKEEENSRKNLCGMKIMTDDSFDKLKQSQISSGKTLQGVHSYDILANPNYLECF